MCTFIMYILITYNYFPCTISTSSLYMHVHVHAVKVSAREGVRKNEDRKTPLDLTQDTI